MAKSTVPASSRAEFGIRILLCMFIIFPTLTSCASTGKDPSPSPPGVTGEICQMIPAEDLSAIIDAPIENDLYFTGGHGYLECHIHFDPENSPSKISIYYGQIDRTIEFNLVGGTSTFEEIRSRIPTTPVTIDGLAGEGFVSFYRLWSFFVWRYEDGSMVVVKFFGKNGVEESTAQDMTGPALEIGRIVAPQIQEVSWRPTASPT